MPPLGGGFCLGRAPNVRAALCPSPGTSPCSRLLPPQDKKPHILGSFSIQARCPVGVWGMCLWYGCLVLVSGAPKQGV